MILNVTNSPFDKEQAEKINTILSTTSKEQKVWLSGYLTANNLLDTPEETGENIPQYQTAVMTPRETREVTILYGSETGNAQILSESMASLLKEKDFHVSISAMNDFKSNKLKKVEDLIIISATHGEGTAPENAVDFYEFLHSRKAPNLKDLRFAVLSLGDESYEYFCQAGKDFDQRLEELGGERIVPRVDCDVDYDDAAEEWINSVISSIFETGGQNVDVPKEAVSTAGVTTEYSRKNPYMAEVLDNIRLNGRGSEKETRHIELSIEDSGLTFEPGDCIGIFPKNDEVLVDQLITLLGWDPDYRVNAGKNEETVTTKAALRTHFEITKLTKPLMKKLSEVFGNESLTSYLEDDDRIREYIYGRDLIDLISDFPPVGLTQETLFPVLRKMPAREYSIASSCAANPDEVHLTIGAVRYHSNSRDRNGVCSVEIAERIEPGEQIPIYVHRNPNFKFPFDDTTPVIMIGPGTGIAPYRSFIEEREELGIEGNTWLFFGEQRFTTDFLYQTDWQNWLNEGTLGRLDLAFSRDTEEKVYVQHLIQESGKDFYQWIKSGASIFVCGDEKKMAKDVHDSILKVLEEEGDMSRDDAEMYLSSMKNEKRYQRDVY
ncbi:assimilatory sulfite reductase (NADPH) flavoprotein subunit [Lacicoccus qingdaonensis]|uniref:assimilatory sulfite reductase (NADPH) n=1 Tax=Lacicoccus qingdaonensis TaxID=576118 RepID=A0A1G9AY33_9BACL|nr:assimilatory sulfite reductase (NADPH) flavoprotein subunit [Salinicoccus qingdaonensis]SDK32108.1 sulfite reductase (NADPH) alpha subunit [Salinicoccus qingdaonensis]